MSFVILQEDAQGVFFWFREKVEQAAPGAHVLEILEVPRQISVEQAERLTAVLNRNERKFKQEMGMVLA
jgi:hypothetical protein